MLYWGKKKKHTTTLNQMNQLFPRVSKSTACEVQLIIHETLTYRGVCQKHVTDIKQTHTLCMSPLSWLVGGLTFKPGLYITMLFPTQKVRQVLAGTIKVCLNSTLPYPLVKWREDLQDQGELHSTQAENRPTLLSEFRDIKVTVGEVLEVYCRSRKRKVDLTL